MKEHKPEPGHYPPTDEDRIKMMEKVGMSKEEIEYILNGRKPKEETEKPELPANVNIHEHGLSPNPEQIKKEKPESPANRKIVEGGVGSQYAKPWFSDETKKTLKKIGDGVMTIGMAGGIVGGAFGGMVGLGLGVCALMSYSERYPYEKESCEVSMIGWNIKKAIGDDYISLDSDGKMQVSKYRGPFQSTKFESEVVDSNLDGKVDKIITFKGICGNHNLEYIRGENINPKIFEKADKKYAEYKEQLSDLIAKAEKAWEER